MVPQLELHAQQERYVAYSSLILTFGQIVVLSCPKRDELAKTLEEADAIADCRPEAINLYEEENYDEEEIEQKPRHVQGS